MSLKHALRVRSAEFWLKLGEPSEALIELEALPLNARRHPWAVQVYRLIRGSVP